MRIWRDERGSALLFTTVLILFLLMVGALAIDLAYLMSAKGELQRSLDAAALAGAGKLGFDSSVFDQVRTAVTNFAAANPYRTTSNGTVSLSSGNITLGVWDGGAFTPWSAGNDPNGTRVNAVRCQWSTTIPTSLLGLLGFSNLGVGALATAVSNPPSTVDCATPLLPLAVTQCSFQDAGTGAFSSQGCGTGLTFLNSSTQCANGPNSPQACNTAAWTSLDGSTPNANYLSNAIQNAANPNPNCAGFLNAGQQAQANNGMIQSVFNTLTNTFVANRTTPLASDVCPAGGCGSNPPIYPASGGGWKVAVMMVSTACPPGPMTGEKQILTYSTFVMTQIFNGSRGCVVSPNPDPQAQSYCFNPDGSKNKDPQLRAVFGYFQCDQLNGVASRDPAPRAALATHVRLVQ